MSRVARAALAALASAVLLGACSVERAPSGRPASPSAAADSAASSEVRAALRLYYARLTTRDWRVLAQSFWPHSTIATLMRSPTDSAERVHTISIEELVAQAAEMPDCRFSFSDEMARATVLTYGPLADAWVTYRARCGTARDSVATHYGIDAVHLMKRGGEWRITNLTFTNELESEPLDRQP